MSIRCLITGHKFTNSTGIFSKTPYCLKCGKPAFASSVNQDALDNHEENICKFITGDNRITRKETVKAILDAVTARVNDGR